jgi:hypothetical protein
VAIIGGAAAGLATAAALAANTASTAPAATQAPDAAPKTEAVTVEQLLDRATKMARQMLAVTGPGWFKLQKITSAFQETPDSASDKLLALVKMGLATTELRQGKVKFKFLLSVSAQVSELRKHEAALQSELGKVQGKIALLLASTATVNVATTTPE